MTTNVGRHHSALVILHRLMAVWVGIALILGSAVLDHTPDTDPGKTDGVRGHLLVGVFIGQGQLPTDFHTCAARSVHGIVSKLLLLTVLAQGAAAIDHQWVRKDPLLSRMGLGQRRDTQ